MNTQGAMAGMLPAASEKGGPMRSSTHSGGKQAGTARIGEG
jgi:hypothetical protein